MQIRLKQYKGHLTVAADVIREHVATNTECDDVVLEVGDSCLDFIAQEMQLDAREALAGVQHYLNGTRHRSTRGTPDTLGTFHEILCFLHHHAEGVGIERVITYEKGAAEDQKRFPTPDFLVWRGGELGVVECKASDGACFHKLDRASKYNKGDFCERVADRRDDALEQLGAVKGGTSAPVAHKLVTAKDRVMPFPSAFGSAYVTAFVDGRHRQLRTEARLTEPKDCRDRSVDCRSCLRIDDESAHCHGLLFRAHNSPGLLLSLQGREGDGESVFFAYKHWSRAAWLGAASFYDEASARFLNQVRRVAGVQVDVLAEGLLAHFNELVSGIRAERGIYHWDQELRDRPAGRRVMGDIGPGPLRTGRWDMDAVGFRIAIENEDGRIRMRALNDSGAAGSERVASRMATELFSTLAGPVFSRVPGNPPLGPAEPVSYSVNGKEHILGWRFALLAKAWWQEPKHQSAWIWRGGEPGAAGLFELRAHHLYVSSSGRMFLDLPGYEP